MRVEPHGNLVTWFSLWSKRVVAVSGYVIFPYIAIMSRQVLY